MRLYHECEGPPERVMIACSGCGKDVATFWAPGHLGLLRGDYDLIADTVWHPLCWEKQVEQYNPDAA